MAKKKNKKPKCPTCKAKLIKVRNKEERYCKKCNYIEPILQAPGDSDQSSIPVDQLMEKGHTEAPVEFSESLVLFPHDEEEIGRIKTDLELEEQKATAQKMENCYAKMSNRSPKDLDKKAREKAEAEHIARIKAKKANGAVISKGLLQLPRVTIHCWSRGIIRGFAYGTQCPYPNPIWSKEMTGVQAHRFLTKVKRGNNKNKLESGAIIEYSET